MAQKNKATAIELYQKLFGDKDIASTDQYIAKDYIQHNPSVADVRDAFKTAVLQWFTDTPKEKVDIQRSARRGSVSV